MASREVVTVPNNLPSVTLCTVTRSARAIIPSLVECVQCQDYPHELIEWIVIDDGDDKVGDIFERMSFNGSVRHIPYLNAVPVGMKKNRALELASNDMVVFLSDHCYYPVTYVQRIVQFFHDNPNAPSTGQNLIYRCDPGSGLFYAATDERVHADTISVRTSILGTRFDDSASSYHDETIVNCSVSYTPDPTDRCICVSASETSIETKVENTPYLPSTTRDLHFVKGVSMSVREDQRDAALDLHRSLIKAELETDGGGRQPDVQHDARHEEKMSPTRDVAREHILEHVRALEMQLREEKMMVAKLRTQLSQHQGGVVTRSANPVLPVGRVKLGMSWSRS